MGDNLLFDRVTIGAAEEVQRTADSATATTLVDTELTEADGFWNEAILRTIRGTGAGQRRAVTGFVAVTDTLTVPAWTTNPAAGTIYLLDRPAVAADMFRAGNFQHTLTVAQLDRAIRDSSLSKFARVDGPRSASLRFTTELRGSGAAGTAPDYGLLFQACGMTEAIVGGASVTYAPTSDKANYKRACITVYIDGLRVMFLGCMGTYTINITLDGVPTIDWEFQAADFDVADDTLIAGAYDSAIPEPCLATGFAFSGFNFNAASIQIALNNTVALRKSTNLSGGHVNALVTGRAPAGSFDPEGVLKATEDIFADWEGQAQVALAVTLGAAAGNICTISAPKCQYSNVGLGDREGMLAYDAPFVCNRNTGDDEISITFT
ncbi:MAG: hypothetical protein HYY66_08685 [Candidatus Tectomicrobia bacterium]|nr:hypothetical protein [Candidatus Tectomicrobia bacterium]